ncbi:16S rRNA (cytidine(1402)-2'-O)-methyltransferase [Hirschia litorea]|uniref:Ribosomal RNA small subunit methyltransferase I n=1 Tax=Hirschia litorea TaxID=1199156 RepID=A0ABW2INJ5_9PROT
MIRPNPDLNAGLYIVATPIGNLRDITLRALDVLASADLVLAEDTRVAAKLMHAYGLIPELRPYHDHNGAISRPRILRELAKGHRIALISDAGTPLVSDPGYKLAREAIEAGHYVTALPGASAPLAALTISGLPSNSFLFAGFPPPKQTSRLKFLDKYKALDTTLIFFEGPSRLAKSLNDMAQVFGNRDAVLARELTKRFEEARRLPLTDLAKAIEEEGPPKGELVVLVGPPNSDENISEEDLDVAIQDALATMSVKQASSEVAEKFGLKKRDVYARAQMLKDEASGK